MGGLPIAAHMGASGHVEGQIEGIYCDDKDIIGRR